MNKDYLAMIILLCIKNLNGERSLSAIYYLLKGKKSSQTIQDGKLYHLSFLFQLFPHMTKHLLEQKASYLENKQLIEKNNDQSFIITEKGKKTLQQQMRIQPIPKELNGWKYHSVANVFWERLSLIVQTISNIVHSNNRFIPIVKNEATVQWVKNFILTVQTNKEQLSGTIYQELFSFFSSVTNKEATLFALRLTSYRRVGLTIEQISLLIEEDSCRVQVLFQGLIHDLINQVLTCQMQYPLLYQLLSDIHQPVPLTYSTKKTYQLLVLGKSINEIAVIRHLKINTIEDHIVELALNLEKFSIEQFIDTCNQVKIEDKITLLKTNQLREIKQALNDSASYFQIRLVLAKCGVRNET